MKVYIAEEIIAMLKQEIKSHKIMKDEVSMIVLDIWEWKCVGLHLFGEMSFVFNVYTDGMGNYNSVGHKYFLFDDIRIYHT